MITLLTKPLPSRNQPCPCGSGARYKHCHGRLDGLSPLPRGTEEALRTIRAKMTAARAFEREHGHVREMISAEFHGYRLVASGRTMYWSKNWKYFADFLNEYLQRLFGKEWGIAQMQLPFELQHPTTQWLRILTEHVVSNSDECLTPDVGAARAWIRLAYDLYLLENNAQLQSKLIRRLRNPDFFQGARFEAAVAAIMLAAGYELQFENEKGPGKHPEFIATPKHPGGTRLAVEAKSKRRPGILGFEGEQTSRVPSLKIHRLLHDAVSKDPVDPLLIFLDLNSPDAIANDSTGRHVYDELSEVWKAEQSKTWPRGFPAAGIVFFNDISHWHPRTQVPPDVPNVSVFVMWADQCRHTFDVKPLLRRISEAVGQRMNVPEGFPN